MSAMATDDESTVIGVDELAQLLIADALPAEMDGLDPERMRAIAEYAMQVIRRRRPGQAHIEVGNGMVLDGKRMSWLAMANDDMPFLVDSIVGALTARGIVVERLLHPVLAAQRAEDGRLLSLRPLSAASAHGSRAESLIFIEMDRVDARIRAEIAELLGDVLASVRQAVDDWPEMAERLSDDARTAADPAARQFLEWLGDNNFTLLGHVEAGPNGVISGTPLGLMRGHAEVDLWDDPETGLAIASVLRRSRQPLLIVKADRQSPVHRRVRADVVIVPRHAADGRLNGASVHMGLFTSQALSQTPETVPLIAERVRRLAEGLGFAPASHAAKTLTHMLSRLPRDLLFELDDAALREFALTSMSLIDRPRPKLRTWRDPFGRQTTVMVWLPADAFSTDRRIQVGQMLADAVDGTLDGWSIDIGEDRLASLRYVVRHAKHRRMDGAELDAQLRMMIRGWGPAVESALRQRVGGNRAARLALSHGEGFGRDYRSLFTADDAAEDIIRLTQLEGMEDRSVRLYRRDSDAADQLRLKIYRLNEVIPLSDVVPVLENFGFRVIDEHPFQLTNGGQGWIHDFLVQSLAGPVDFACLVPVLETAIRDVLVGRAENDLFNALITDAGIASDAVTLFRAWFRYMRQTGVAYGLSTIAEALRRHPQTGQRLVALFRAMHDPELGEEARAKALSDAEQALDEALGDVSAIDDDAILRRIRALIRATLRTNAFVPGGPEALAMKFDSAAVPGLPAPVPWREIFVYSPRVEGIHLRGGPVARGGLRWSDRRDDYRTEILGLMKAQVVKNAVIVPTGAKGGFYPKMLPPATDRDAWMAEGTEAYRIFIRALLSITDNIVEHALRHPDHVVIRDDDDPYFVVAADKGTASFSDVANDIAIEQGFWLGDAFASGGSQGYDHKAMGITARGAWVSVQRHFAEQGVDVQADPISVAGVGDMSGDVFGNGMLLSRSLRLVAAFDHRHIFIDPDPDAEAGWMERKRLFDLPRSSWADYDKTLISKGGGVFPRTQKRIGLSPEARAALGIDEEALDPSALVRAILAAPVDLLWFGGIGTYIKGSDEPNGAVGDRANDGNRINGRDVRARVIGEGANLGVTQAGRIEFAARGGRINTDFIDNSAGVDCSDNEVNIKIALNAEMAADRLQPDDRNAFLREMTDAVAELVLEDNRLQTLALSVEEKGGAAALPSYQRVIQTMEQAGRIDRAVEGLPDDEKMAALIRDDRGLERPALAVLLSHAKLTLQAAIEDSALPDDPLMKPVLLSAFPSEMADRFAPAIEAHRLRREIIATKIANGVINRGGIVLPFALAEEEGVSLARVAAAYAAVDALFDMPGLWSMLEKAPVQADVQLALIMAAADALRLHVADMVRIMSADDMPDEVVRQLRAGVTTLDEALDELLGQQSRAQADALRERLTALGGPQDVVERIVRLSAMDGALGIARLAVALDRRGEEEALTTAYIRLGDALDLDWAKGQALALDPADPWERLLVAGLVREFEQLRLDLLERIVDGAVVDQAVSEWLDAQQSRVEHFRTLVAQARRQGSVNAVMLSHIASQARALLGQQT